MNDYLEMAALEHTGGILQVGKEKKRTPSSVCWICFSLALLMGAFMVVQGYIYHGNVKAKFSEFDSRISDQIKKMENVELEDQKELISIIKEEIDKTIDIIVKLNQSQSKQSFGMQKMLKNISNNISGKEELIKSMK